MIQLYRPPALLKIGFVAAFVAMAASSAYAQAVSMQDGLYALEQKDYQRAYDIFSGLAAAGEVQAHIPLGDMHLDGLGRPADPARAAEHYQIPAEAGDVEAQSQLGFLYGMGYGVPYSQEMAEHWNLKAIAQGSLMAMNNQAYDWAQRGQKLEESLRLISRVLAAGDRTSSTLDTYGWILYKMGRYVEAVPPLCQARELEPGHPEIRFHLGDAYWRIGMVDAAKEEWVQADSLRKTERYQSEQGARFLRTEEGQSWERELDQRLATGGLSGEKMLLSDKQREEITKDCTVPNS